MKLIIISGLSGSGKSIALNVLEDLDYYCIDNLPIGLITVLSDQLLSDSHSIQSVVAVGIDSRNHPDGLKHFDKVLQNLKDRKIETEVIFLQADDATLIKRFSETRRKHPLSDQDTSLDEAIIKERDLLHNVTANADLIIDSTHTNIYQLRDLIKESVHSNKQENLSVTIESFGFKHGIPNNADYVFDVRCLPNPHWEPKLRAYTGKDKPVQDFLACHDDVNTMYEDIRNFLEKWIPKFQEDNRSYITIAIGCTGGQHRSVYIVERLVAALSTDDNSILIRHRELS